MVRKSWANGLPEHKWWADNKNPIHQETLSLQLFTCNHTATCLQLFTCNHTATCLYNTLHHRLGTNNRSGHFETSVQINIIKFWSFRQLVAGNSASNFALILWGNLVTIIYVVNTFNCLEVAWFIVQPLVSAYITYLCSQWWVEVRVSVVTSDSLPSMATTCGCRPEPQWCTTVVPESRPTSSVWTSLLSKS